MFQGILHWEESTDMPLPRSGYMAGAVSGKLLLAGGSYWDKSIKRWSRRADFFDPESGRWSETAPLPEERSDAACAAIGDTLYLFGGAREDSVRRDALAFRNGQWNRIETAALPAPRMYSVAAALGSRIYLSGGIAESGKYESASNDFMVWDTAHPENGWRLLPPLPGKPRFTHAMTANQGRVYVFGGATAGGPDVQNLQDAYVFDPSTNEWTRLPDLPMPRRAWAAVVRGSDLFLIGGYTNTYETDVFQFDAATRRLRPAGTLPHPSVAAIAVSVNGNFVVTGGEVADRVRGKWTLLSRR